MFQLILYNYYLLLSNKPMNVCTLVKWKSKEWKRSELIFNWINGLRLQQNSQIDPNFPQFNVK